MKVLIIGGTRFIGPHIIRGLLAAGHQVVALNRGKSPAPLPPEVERITCDKAERDRFRTALIEAKPDACIDTCLQADDLEVACEALSGRLRQFIHTGSTGVYTPMQRLPAREDDPIRIVPGITFEEKWAQDQVLLRWRDERDFPATIIRPTNVFGPGAVPLDLWGCRTPTFFQRAADSRPLTLPNDGRALIQPVDVEDLASAYCLALATERSIGQIYNISSACALMHQEYLAVIMDVYTRCIRGWHLERHLGQELTLAALEPALLDRLPEIHHSDQGVQYAATAYVDLLHDYGIAISMTDRGQAWQNGYA